MSHESSQIRQLAAYDEALRGEPATTASAPLVADSAFELLRQLHRAWPARREEGPATAADGARPAGQPSLPFGRFEIQQELGRGGFGVVYLARDTMLGRDVALKLPRVEALVTPELRARFLNEARAAAALEHRHIVPVYEAGEIGPLCYIASAYCPGENMAQWLTARSEPVGPRTAAAMVALLADAVAYSHAQGVIHRDLKPANVMLDPVPPEEQSSATNPSDEVTLPFTPRVTDFGLARCDALSASETRSSVLLGTPLYMAPELTSGAREAGPPVDVYALGAILYELLTLRPPFSGAGFFEVIEKVRHERPRSPREISPQVASDLETICLKALEKRPADRYASATALADDLRRFLRGEAIQGRPVGLAGEFWRWCQRPERIRDAGLLAVAINGTLITWVVVAVSIDMAGVTAPNVMDAHDQGMQLLGLVLGLLSPHLLLGMWTLRRSGIAIWLNALLFALHAGVALGGLLGLMAPFSAQYTDSLQRWAVYSLLLAIYSMQFLAYVLAILAWRRRRADDETPAR